jgi:hypothetical protein
LLYYEADAAGGAGGAGATGVRASLLLLLVLSNVSLAALWEQVALERQVFEAEKSTWEAQQQASQFRV